MPIERTFTRKCDPTSPECLVAKTKIEELSARKKAAEVKQIVYLVVIICSLVITAAIVFASVAFCKWAGEHYYNYTVVKVPDYGTVMMEKGSYSTWLKGE